MLKASAVLLRVSLFAMQLWGVVAAAWMLFVAVVLVLESTGAWLPATVAGYAWSKWHRQCDTEAELKRSLPIARLR